MTDPFRHPADNPGATAKVTRFAPLVSRGLLTTAECVEAVILQFPPRDAIHRSGLQARLSWALNDAVADLERRRRYVASLIRSYAWPAMDQRTPPATILAQVARINRENGTLFEDGGRDVAEECCEQWLRREARTAEK